MKKIPIKDIKPNPDNPRFIQDEKFEKLKASIREFPKMMELRPIVIDSAGMVLGGNMRLRALQDLGYKEVSPEWVRRADDMTEDEKRRFIITDNAGFGQWDWDVLANEWDAADLADWGLDAPEEWGEEELEVEEDDYTEPENIRVDVVPGDLIEIGRHRLLCGDSTNVDDMDKLIGGEIVTLSFTSPPYNLGVSSKMSGNTEIGSRGNLYESYNDNDEQKWVQLMNGFTSNVINYSQYSIVNVQSLAGNKTSLWKWINDFSDYYCDVAVWDKSHAAPQQAQRVMNSVFEFLFFFTKENPSRAIRCAPEFRGTVDNVFRIPPQRNNDFAKIHGGTFPLELPYEMIKTFSKQGDSILDAFIGSGTTMVAAHQLNRTCYGMEIDPKYCQVVIDRMRKLDPALGVKINGKKYEPKQEEEISI